MVNTYLYNPYAQQQMQQKTKISHQIELTTWRSSVAIEESRQAKINHLRSQIFSFLANINHVAEFSESDVNLFRNYVDLKGSCKWTYISIGVGIFPVMFVLIYKLKELHNSENWIKNIVKDATPSANVKFLSQIILLIIDSWKMNLTAEVYPKQENLYGSLLETLVDSHEYNSDFEPFALAVAKKYTTFENCSELIVKAMKKGMREFAKFILENNPHQFLENQQHVTPLHMACMHGWEDLILTTLKANKQLANQLSVLIGLPNEILLEICTYVRRPYDVLHQDSNGSTALHYLLDAPEECFLAVFPYILKLGKAIMCHTPNHNGISPLEYARLARKTKAARCILEVVATSQEQITSTMLEYTLEKNERLESSRG